LKEAYRPNIFHALGEDAVNIAWTIFLSFTRRYKGKNFKGLPGLIQYHVHFELQHAVEKVGKSWDNELISEELLTIQAYEPLEKITSDLALQEIFKKLTPRQYRIIDLYYGQGHTHQDIAEIFGCTVRHIKRQKLEALTIIKQYL
jgi:RNA polymerase sigma factor (sigma-70 family)